MEVSTLAQAVETGIAGLLILLVGFAVTSSLRTRGSAAQRHLVWAAALVSVLSLPVFEWALPRWEALPDVEAYLGRADIAPALSRSAESATWSGARMEEIEPEHALAVPEPTASVRLMPGGSEPRELSAARATRARDGFDAVPLSGWLIGLWGLGAMALLARLAVGAWARQRLFARDAVPSNPTWERDAAWAAQCLGVKRAVQVVGHGRLRVPVTWGTLRPTIVLPLDAVRWTRQHRRGVLLHEMAHVARADHLIQTLAAWACALYWPNPLVWVAAKRLRAEAELACDDRVLGAGQRPSEYAEGLLSIAGRIRAYPVAPTSAVAMVRRADLAGRLDALLDPLRNRGGVSRLAVFVGVVTCLLVTVPLAALAPAEQELVDAGRSPAEAVRSVNVAPRQGLLAESTPGVEVQPQLAPFAPCSFARTGRGTREVVSGSNGRHEVLWETEDCSVTAVLDRVRFTDDESALASVQSGGHFSLEQDGPEERLQLRAQPSANGTLQFRFRVDGDDREFGDAGRVWLAATIPQIFRTTGYQAKERAARIIDRGGISALLDEVDLMDSDHTIGVYLAIGLQHAAFSDADLGRVFGAVADRIESDHEASSVLQTAWRPELSRQARDEFLRAASGLDSDHELSRVIATFMDRSTSEVDGLAVLRLAASSLESDHERGAVLRHVLANVTATPQVQRQVLEVVEVMDSSHERGQVLLDLIRTAATAEELETTLVVEGATGLDSAYEMSRVLQEVLQVAMLPERDIMHILDGANVLDSEYEQAELLSRVAVRYAAQSDRVRARVREMAQELDSDYERERILDRLDRREKP